MSSKLFVSKERNSRWYLLGFRQSVAVLGMRNGTSQSPFRPALGRQLVRAADAPLRGHGFGTSRLRQTPTTNGLTAYRMRLHLACVSSGTYGPFATSASRSRLRLPRTTRLALRASLAGSDCACPRNGARRLGTTTTGLRDCLFRQYP